MSAKPRDVQRLSCSSHILLNTMNLFKRTSGIGAAGTSWCFICSVWEWSACGCVCSTLTPTVGLLSAVTYPTLHKCATVRPSGLSDPPLQRGREIVSKTPTSLNTCSAFTDPQQASPPSHKQMSLCLCCAGVDVHPWLGCSAQTNATHNSANVTWPWRKGFGYITKQPLTQVTVSKEKTKRKGIKLTDRHLFIFFADYY